MNNQKIDFVIPDWVNWLAQDEDGSWWGYSVEPLQHHKGWYENEVGQHQLLAKTASNPHWRSSLRQHKK